MIEIRVIGLEDLTNATGEMKKWGERPFDGVASFYIRKNWMDRIDRAFVTKGQSIGTKWIPLWTSYAAWMGRHFPGRPLLVLRGPMKQSLTDESSRNAIYNRKGGRQLILGTRIKYAKFHQYGTDKMPARKFFKVDQGLVNDWAKEMSKDVKLAQEGSKRWRAR